MNDRCGRSVRLFDASPRGDWRQGIAMHRADIRGYLRRVFAEGSRMNSRLLPLYLEPEVPGGLE